MHLRNWSFDAFISEINQIFEECKLRDDGRVHGGGDTVVTISAVDTEDATGVTENTSRWLWLRWWLPLIQ